MPQKINLFITSNKQYFQISKGNVKDCRICKSQI